MQNSKLYANLILLNKQYQFNYTVSDKLQFSNACKSKRGLESFDFTKNLRNIIIGNFNYYNGILATIHRNADLWQNYLIEYQKVNVYATQEDISSLKIRLKTFNNHEKILYKKLMLKKPVTTLTADFIATYTSPAGKNSYSLSKQYSQRQIENIINEYLFQLREAELKEKEKQQKQLEREERKRQKIITATQNEKKHQELIKREEILSQKEAEFNEATQGHIYSATHENTTVQEVVNEDTDSLWTKLNKLKQQFNNGKITYQEYEARRKELL
jgi:hypothetical protein